MSSSVPNPQLNGFKVGTYRILELIGRGGMATVYKAYHPSTDRLVALKVLLDYFDPNSVAAQRFEQEAHVIAKLEHPHIVPVYDFGQEGNILYLVMRYMRAGTIQDIISRGPMSLRDTSNLISEIALALDYAHSFNIIHRDIKPNNILVDAQGRPHLSDFGLAKVLDGPAELTKTSSRLGTPAYMAPEQTMGLPVTPQTDIYSLGIMLYEMLTGTLPFSADTPMAVAMMHIQGLPRLPREINKNISNATESIILRAMAKDPADRFETASALARKLEEVAEIETETLTKSTSQLKIAAAEIAQSKSPEEVTLDIRDELKRLDFLENRKKLVAASPWIVAALLLLGLITTFFVNFESNQRAANNAAQTATAVTILINQLGDVQTAAAGGQTGLEPTLRFLETSLASSFTIETLTTETLISGSPTSNTTLTPSSFLTPSRTPFGATQATNSSNATATLAGSTPTSSGNATATQSIKTNTPISQPTNTPVPQPTNTPIPQPTNTPVPQATNTPIIVLPTLPLTLPPLP